LAARKRVMLKWLVVLLLLPPVLFAAFVAFAVLFLEIKGYRARHGYNYEGANIKWATAMRNGDAPQAIYWAERMIHYAFPEDDQVQPWLRSRSAAYSHLAAAYELAGAYNKALTLYQQYEGSSLPEYVKSPLAEARVFYKLGQRKQAFRAYCLFAVGTKRARPSWHSLKHTKEVIVGTFYPEQGPLAAFRSYDEFLDFMKREWEALGRLDDYLEAVEFLDDMAYDHRQRIDTDGEERKGTFDFSGSRPMLTNE